MFEIKNELFLNKGECVFKVMVYVWLVLKYLFYVFL